jgi:hypothetical protein
MKALPFRHHPARGAARPGDPILFEQKLGRPHKAGDDSFLGDLS